MTGLKRQTVSRAIKKLSSKKIIVIIKNDDSQINIYRFNKNFDQWKLLSKKMTVSSKKITTVIKKDNLLSSKKRHTKDTSTKDTSTKEKLSSKFSPKGFSDFEKFYFLYPNKKSKREALDRWKKMKKEKSLPSLEILLTAIESQKRWREQADENEFIPSWKNPAVWLNKGCWEDEMETPFSKKESNWERRVRESEERIRKKDKGG
jgi:hypothetical protein